MKKRQFIIVGVGLMLIAGALWLSGILSGMKEPPKVEEPKVVKKYVKTAPVYYANIPTQVVAFGRVRTAESLDLIAEVSGRMSAGHVKLKEGQRFRKGNLLYSIDATEARLGLQADKSNFLRDLASILPDLKIDFTDSYAGWNTYFNAIDLDKSLPELPKPNSSKEKTFLATKGIYSSYYAIKSKEANLRKHYFYAPFNGAISEINLQSGSFVNPGNKIAKILRTDNLEIRVDVNMADIDWIDRGASVSVTSESGIEWQGKVSRIGDFVNQNTQSIDVFVAVNPKQDAKMYDGEYLKSNIPGKIVDKGMIIPRNAIFNGNEVFVLQDSVLKVKEITIHKLNAETAIFSGLAEGTDLVVEPLINAHNNMKAYKLEDRERDIDLEKKEGAEAKLVKS